MSCSGPGLGANRSFHLFKIANSYQSSYKGFRNILQAEGIFSLLNTNRMIKTS